MPTHVALLRGINVGASTRVGMPRLRELVEDLGHGEVATYLQSGNLVLTPSGRPSAADLAASLRRAIAAEFAVDPVVVVLTAAQWDEAVDGLPYPGQDDPTKVHAAVQQEPVTAAQRAALEAIAADVAEAGSPDQLAVRGRVTYLHTPAGFGRSKLAERLARTLTKTGQDHATARNWRTVLALQDLLAG